MKLSATNGLIGQVTLRQLQIFEAVVRLKGFTRAGEELLLTQPTVSMQIRKLTESLNLALLEQTGRKVQPTVAGKKVYITAREILERMADLDTMASELSGVVSGDLRLAVISTATFFMPHLMGAFVRQHPLVTPRLTVTNRAQVLERLKTGTDDLLIMGQVPEGLPVQAHPFIDNEIVVVAPSNHPLATARNISLAQISKEPFLVRETGSGTRQAVDRLFASHDLKVSPYMELGSSEAIKQGVISGLGISALSVRNLRLELENNCMSILDVEDFPLVRRWYAVHLEGKKLSLAARSFLEYILDDSNKILSKSLK